MNERIKLFTKQATIRVNNPFVNSDGKVVCDDWEEGVSLSKFAELILTDVIHQIRNKQVGNRCTFTTYDNATVDCAKTEIINMIETTYNVKEKTYDYNERMDGTGRL